MKGIDKILKVITINETNRDKFQEILANQNRIEQLLAETIGIDDLEIESPGKPGTFYSFKNVNGILEMDLVI